MKQYYLLPFKAQLAGWILLPLSIICFSAIGIFRIEFLAKEGFLFFLFLLPYLSLFLICFSREKREDEYLSFLRGRSLFITAVILGFIMVFNGAQGSALRFGIMTLQDVSSFGSFLYKSSPLLIMVVYLIVYKSSLFISTLKARKNEE